MNILVTGAGKGLGFELVKKFSEEEGNTIIAVSRNIEALNNYLSFGHRAKMPFSEVIPYSFDLVNGDYPELTSFVSLHVTELNALVNNAGVLVNKPLLEIDSDDFAAVFNTNVRAAFQTVQALYPLFIRGTHVVNISSMGGFQGSVKFPGLSVYSASKGALGILTECLAEELKLSGVVVNALALGSVKTEMFSAAFPGFEAQVTAPKMAEYITEFVKTGYHFLNGKIIPVSLSTP